MQFGHSESMIAQPTRVLGRPIWTEKSAPTFPIIVRVSFILFIFAVPFEGVSLFSQGSFSVAKLAGYVFFVSLLRCPKRFLSHVPAALPMKWFLAYLVIYTFGFVTAEQETLPFLLRNGLRLLQLFLFFFVASEILKEAQLARIALVAFCVACGILASGSIFGLPGFASGDEGGRNTTLDYNENQAAFLMALALISIVGLWLYGSFRSRWPRYVLAGLFLPCLIVLLKTGSRSGTGMVLIGLSVFLIPSVGLKKLLSALIVTLFTAAAIGYIAISLHGTSVAFDRWKRAYYQNDFAARERLYPAALKMISERPVTGWGHYEKELAGRPLTAHNLILHLLLQVGIVGSVPFIIGVAVCLKKAWQGRHGNLAFLPLGLMLAVLANTVTHTGISSKATWLFFALAVSTCPVLRQSVKHRIGIRSPVDERRYVHAGR
jgi:O-antigen ligase